MSFTKGDVVKVGNGSTRYTVLGQVSENITVIQSHTTSKSTSQKTDRLNLVQAVQDVAEEAGASVEELVIPAQTDVPLISTAQPKIPAPVEPLTGTVVSTVPERSAYSKAILAALQLKSHMFQGLNRPKTRSTTRARKMAKNARRQARKAAKR